MPGLRLTFAQACRLWQVDAATCDVVLRTLVDEAFLVCRQDGSFIALPTTREYLRMVKAAPPPAFTPPRRLVALADPGPDSLMTRIPTVATVLLVDAGRDDRAVYAEYLRLLQFRAVEIDNTADALALAVTADVIVSDIRVPGPFDGIELVRRLRAGGSTKDKAIVMLTACAFEPDQQRTHRAGCDAFLAKPCLPETLVSEIRRVLAGRATRKRPAPSRMNHKQRDIA